MSTTSNATQTLVLDRSSTRRRSFLRLLVVGLFGLFASLLIVGPAQAYTVTSASNVPVRPTFYKVQGLHYNAGQAVTGPMYKPWIYQKGPVVYRNGSGTQYVKAVYTVQKWNGAAWVTVATQTKSTVIGSGYTSAQMPALSVLPSGYSGGYFHVKLSLTWTNQIGAVTGSMQVSMNAASDYTCNTNRTCSVGGGWVYLG
jgi:hypothetical protein